jgi:hypothetical protein
LYMLMVPFNEDPLEERHRFRFTDASFPFEVERFRLLDRVQVTVDPLVWNGPQMLAIYASAAYAREPASVATEIMRLRHANAHKDRVLTSLEAVLREREKGIKWLRVELEAARHARP